MQLTHVPLLQIQRDLYRIPRGAKRFQAYLHTMIDPDTSHPRLPLSAMNPMAKDHVPTLLDDWLALDAESVAQRALEEVQPRVADAPGTCNVGLVMADDRGGGWTNRYDIDFRARFDKRALPEQGWLVTLLWSSEPASVDRLVEQVRMTVLRAKQRHLQGAPHTLRQRMAFEGQVMAEAECTTPTLEADELTYTAAVIEPFLDTTDMRTSVECLYGDAAGRTLGFTPRGLGPDAGLALALHQAIGIQSPEAPTRT